MASSSVAASATRWALKTRASWRMSPTPRLGLGFELLQPLGGETESPCVLFGVREHALGHVGKPERPPKRIPHLTIDPRALADLARTEGRRPEPISRPTGSSSLIARRFYRARVKEGS